MKNFLSNSIRAFAVLGLTLFASVAIAQTTLYKYIGPDGKTVYSDKPPPKGVKYDTLTPDTKPNGFNPSASNPPPNAAEVNASIEARRAQQTAHDGRVATAQENYNAAVAALEAAKEPQEGERTQNANGTSRLNENYFNRVGDLQRKVDEAKAALDSARGE
jgi:hypothetical protein